MKILDVIELLFKEVKVIRFERFPDMRGYFTESFRESDFNKFPFMKDNHFFQCNESYSSPRVIRGLHFQWNPYMSKLVRTVQGHMIDMVMDIRKGSPNYGKIIAYDMPSEFDSLYAEWIWVPVGFAHGNYFMKKTYIEYFCTGEHSPKCEVAISPLSKDIDWSLCDEKLRRQFHDMAYTTDYISQKDKDGLSVSQWEQDSRSENFIY